MCLDKLSEFKVKLNKEGIGVGFKVFVGNSIFGLKAEWNGTQYIRSENKWLREGDFRADKVKHTKKIGYSSVKYPLGFHVFLSKRAAKQWGGGQIRKVKFRRVVATGLQMTYKCIVAKEIFIPKEARI